MDKIMVELASGYGDGYGVVAADNGQLVINPARSVTRYADGSPMEPWKQKLLSSTSVDLIDGGVRVPPGAVVRIIGPLDCPEAVRIRVRRFVRNWPDQRFVALATDQELADALAADDGHAIHAALCALESRYVGQAASTPG